MVDKMEDMIRESQRRSKSRMPNQPLPEQGKGVFDYFSGYKDTNEQPETVRDNSNQEMNIIPEPPQVDKPKSARKTSRGSRRSAAKVEEPKKPSLRKSDKKPSAPKRRLVSRIKSKAKKLANNSKLRKVENIIEEGIDTVIVGAEKGIEKGAKVVTKSNVRKVGKAVGKGAGIVKKGAKAVPKAIQKVDNTLTGVGTANDVTDLVKLKYEHDKITKYRAEYKASHPSDTGYIRFEAWMGRHYEEFMDAHPDALARYDKSRTFPRGLPKYESGNPYKRYYTGGQGKGDGYTPYPDFKGGPVTIKDLIAGTAIHAAKANRDGYHEIQKRFEKNAEGMQKGRERGRADIPAVMANKHRGLPPADRTAPALAGNRGGLKRAGEAAAGIKVGLKSTAPNLGAKPNAALGRKPTGGPGVRKPTGPAVRTPNVEFGGYKPAPGLGPRPIPGGNALTGDKQPTNVLGHRNTANALGQRKTANVLGEKRRPSYNITKGRPKENNTLGEKRRPSYNIAKGRPKDANNTLGGKHGPSYNIVKGRPKDTATFSKKQTAPKTFSNAHTATFSRKHTAPKTFSRKLRTPKFEAKSETFEEVTNVPTIEQIEEFIDGDRPSMLDGAKLYNQ